MTLPPGLLIYNDIGRSGASASRNSSCATMDADTVSSTAPFRQMIRSLRSREKMSYVCHPPDTLSVTMGVGVQLRGGVGGRVVSCGSWMEKGRELQRSRVGRVRCSRR